MPRFLVEYNAYYVNNTWRDDRVVTIEAPNEVALYDIVLAWENSLPDQLRATSIHIKKATSDHLKKSRKPQGM